MLRQDEVHVDTAGMVADVSTEQVSPSVTDAWEFDGERGIATFMPTAMAMSIN